MAKKKKSISSTLLTVLIVSGILLGAAGYKLYEDVLGNNINLDENETGYVYVYTRLNFEENMQVMESRGMLNNTASLKRLLSLSGYADLIKPGKYKVQKGMNNLALMRMLVGGTQAPFDVVFKQANRKEDLIRFFSTQLECDSNELYAMFVDSNFCAQLGFDTANIVSMFIPNTYNFYWNTSADELTERFKIEYHKFWNDARKQKAEQLGLTPLQVSVLASIVQKETYQKDEMSTVAGVYLNRLKRGMPLQADPTLLFIANNPEIKRVGGKLLELESPYNTYKYKGLPPGPICVPNSFTIDAVLNTKPHSYLYFCAREDLSGYHNFAASFVQHQRNAVRYQRMLNQKGIK